MDSDGSKPGKPGVSSAPGRVAVDGRGHNVWQWNGEQTDSTTIMLQQLDNAELALEPTRDVPTLDIAAAIEADGSRARHLAGKRDDAATDAGEQASKGGRTGGFDPYNRS